jgi:hypothetical protein
MLSTNNYSGSVPIEMPIDYFPLLPTKNTVAKKVQFANTNDYKRISETSNFKHLSVSYNAYKAENKSINTTIEPAKRKIKEFVMQQRVFYNFNQLQYTPTSTIETFLFEKNSEKTAMLYGNFGVGDFINNHWLNTPGPIYTTQTNNNNAGKLLATTNIACDENDSPIIFKQPCTQKETDLLLLAVIVNDGDGFCADGNKNWNKTNVTEWWAKSEERIDYIIEAYKTELFTPLTKYSAAKTSKQRPIPENYKLWLDFYRYDMKKYLEWYILKLVNEVVALPELTVDWCLKDKLDKILTTKLLSNLN